MIDELWKDIDGYEGTYQVSNMGRVRRLTFVNNVVKKNKIHIINPTDNGNGYLIVGLKIDGKRQNRYVHRLVAKAFCENPDGKRHVNHKDYDKKNNMAINLEWCTQRENVRYSSTHMKHPKEISRPTNTGEKYIRLKGNSYVVCVRGKCEGMQIYKSFKNLGDAVTFRDEYVRCLYG